MANKSLQHLLETTDHCIVAPCVYDCASARAVEMVGFEAMMLSGGEVSISMNGVIDYGFTSLTDVEWITSRISQTSAIPLAADIEDGFGGPLAVYRSARRMIMAGAKALQLEDSADMEATTSLLPREKYYEKVRAALAAMEGSDCFLIARTNADPATELDEGCERMAAAVEMGAKMSTVVRIATLNHAQHVAHKVPGWKMFPDVRDIDGKPGVTVEQIYPLGFNFLTMHYTLKAAMDGMLEHGLKNYAQQGLPLYLPEGGRDRHHGHERLAAVRPAQLHGTGKPLRGREEGLHHRGQCGGGFSRRLRALEDRRPVVRRAVGRRSGR